MSRNTKLDEIQDHLTNFGAGLDTIGKRLCGGRVVAPPLVVDNPQDEDGKIDNILDLCDFVENQLARLILKLNGYS